MSRRTRNTRLVESTERPEAGVVDSLALLVPLSPVSGAGTHLTGRGVVGDPFPRVSDPYAPPDTYNEGKAPTLVPWVLVPAKGG
jgi:hypothetical protein